MRLYRAMRTSRRDGQWRQIVSDLEEIAEENQWPENMATEMKYLCRHVVSGRLNFTQFRKQVLPLRSGAIQSNNRRVISTRMKSDGDFWGQNNVEIMLQLRYQVITNRWDERMESRCDR